jgi:hypothetical protein
LEQRREDLFGAAIVAALIALALAFGAQRGRRAVPVASRAGEITELGGPIGRFSFFPTSGRIDAASADGRSRVDLEMSLVVDGTERPLVMRRAEVKLHDRNTLAAAFPIELGDERAVGTLTLRMDPASDILSASLVVMPEAGSSSHSYALRVGLAPEGRSVFIPGAGETNEAGAVTAHTVVVDDDAHPIALLSSQGDVSAAETPPAIEQPNARPRLVVTTKTETSAQRPASTTSLGKPARLDLSVLVGASSQLTWGRLYRVLRQPVGRLTGVVTGTKERAHLVGLDDEGRALVRTITDAHGHFALEAPTDAVQWYAVLEAAHSSTPVRFMPGTPWDLRLDVSPGGELHVNVVDEDTGQPVVARLLVKGVEGTLDPSFGPDYRASGAGPLMDVLEGDVVTPLPAGHYRVSATKGIEWSIDAETVEVPSGHRKDVDLAIRHVVPTPGMVGCDLHVHARPSFDSPVTPEDRVLSLVSAGVDFAVPTEHNIVGDYTAPLELLHLGKQLAHVSGVEVTTYNPRFGHFGVFPFPPGGSVPPYRGTTAAGIFGAARRGDASRVVQVNHPRMQMGIGYFNIVGFDPRTGRIPPGMRTDFDTLEVYNGFELGRRELTDRVMDDWFGLLNLGKRIYATGSSDSHRIQYQWAGYPRTYALVDPRAAGDTGRPIETKEVVSAIKKGRSFVTSGPILDVELESEGKTARPGDEIPVAKGAEVRGHITIHAARWVDVTSIEVVAGIPATPLPKGPVAPKGAPKPAPASPLAPHEPGSVHVVWTTKIPSSPTFMGKEDGSTEEAASRTIRFDDNVSFAVPDKARWLVVMVRGDRPLDDALPFMPVQPLGFTNPIWLSRP